MKKLIYFMVRKLFFIFLIISLIGVVCASIFYGIEIEKNANLIYGLSKDIKISKPKATHPLDLECNKEILMIVDFNPLYFNNWLQKGQSFEFSLSCSGVEPISYNWVVDGVSVSDVDSFTFDSRNYVLGDHLVIGYCYDDLDNYNSKEFNLELLDSSDFTLIVLPDTQDYAKNYPEIFLKQTNWIKDVKDKLNVVFVTHLGDVVDGGDSDESQWISSKESLSLLNGIIPYGLIIGNHDYDDKAKTRSAIFWDNYFPLADYNNYSWWGGNFDNTTQNTYQYFASGDFEFLIFHLEFCPRNEILNWANQIILENLDKRVIISTHSYLYSDDTWVDASDRWDCTEYGIEGNNGDEIWDKLVRKHKNIFLVLNGHILNDGTGYLESNGDKGNKIVQILSNYQCLVNGACINGPTGYLRIMRFNPFLNKVFVQTYSPYLDNFNVNLGHEFSFDLIEGDLDVSSKFGDDPRDSS